MPNVPLLIGEKSHSKRRRDAVIQAMIEEDVEERGDFLLA